MLFLIIILGECLVVYLGVLHANHPQVTHVTMNALLVLVLFGVDQSFVVWASTIC